MNGQELGGLFRPPWGVLIFRSRGGSKQPPRPPRQLEHCLGRNSRTGQRKTGIWRAGKWLHQYGLTLYDRIYPANRLSIAINRVTVCQRRCFSGPALSSHNINELLDFICIFSCELRNNYTNDYKNKNSNNNKLTSKSSILVSISVHNKNCILQRTLQIKCSWHKMRKDYASVYQCIQFIV